MFVTGHDTISNMLYWIIIYLAKHQDVQEKLQKEIDENVPLGHLPAYEHKDKYAYGFNI